MVLTTTLRMHNQEIGTSKSKLSYSNVLRSARLLASITDLNLRLTVPSSRFGTQFTENLDDPLDTTRMAFIVGYRGSIPVTANTDYLLSFSIRQLGSTTAAVCYVKGAVVVGVAYSPPTDLILDNQVATLFESSYGSPSGTSWTEITQTGNVGSYTSVTVSIRGLCTCVSSSSCVGETAIIGIDDVGLTPV
ncbi:hypothetical protein ABW21_db0202134 [Orbilia brochopaga]|nr:hypothetical protein ABW21_db0202134 [Drechslerella brochopaga]